MIVIHLAILTFGYWLGKTYMSNRDIFVCLNTSSFYFAVAVMFFLGQPNVSAWEFGLLYAGGAVLGWVGVLVGRQYRSEQHG